MFRVFKMTCISWVTASMYYMSVTEILNCFAQKGLISMERPNNNGLYTTKDQHFNPALGGSGTGALRRYDTQTIVHRGETLRLLDNRTYQLDNGILIHSIVVRRMTDLVPFHPIADRGFSLRLHGRPGIRPELNPSGQLVCRDMGEFDQSCRRFGWTPGGHYAGVREHRAELVRRGVRCRVCRRRGMLMEISTPSSLESSGLDDRRLDVPRWDEFFVQGFGKPFQGFCGSDDKLQYAAIRRRLTEFPSTVVSEARYCVVSASSADVKDILALVGGGILSKELDSLGTASITVEHHSTNKAYLQRYLCRTPE